MPRRELRRASLLDEHMLMKNTRTVRAHESLRNRRSDTVFDEIPERFNAMPVAVIAEEAPRRFLGRVVPERRSRISGVVLHAFAQHFDPVREHPAQDGGAVTLKDFPFRGQHAALLSRLIKRQRTLGLVATRLPLTKEPASLKVLSFQ